MLFWLFRMVSVRTSRRGADLERRKGMAVNTNKGRARARWGSLALVGALSLLLAQLVWAGPAGAQAVGDELWAADGAGGNTETTLYKVNPATGARSETIGEIGFSVTGLAFDPTTDQLYGSTTSNDATEPGSLIRINTDTGAGTLVGPAGTRIVAGCDTGTADITFTTDGQLWGWSECTDDLYNINKATGVGTLVGDSGFGSFGSGLSADPDDNTIWFTGDGDSGLYHTVDKTTGLLTSQGTLDGTEGNSINSLAWTCDGETLFGTHNRGSGAPTLRDLVTIDTSTDSINTIGPSDQQQDAIAWNCAPPEPTVFCKGIPATIEGTSGNDVLTGTNGRDVIVALGGNDRVNAQGGTDLVCAGAGKDRVNGKGGKDRLLGQGGNDRLRGGAGKDNLRGGGGRDRCNGGPGVDTGNCEKEVSIP
jgi:Ca2+-binding RTX toxin-like protein